MENKTQHGWIWIRENDEHLHNRKMIADFRKNVEFTGIPDDCTLKITADARYKLYINGILVNAGPQKGDNSIRYYDRIDISGYLSPGRNLILVKVLTIPFRQNAGNASVFRTETPGLFLDGVISSDESWEYRIADIRVLEENQHFAPLQIFEEATGPDNYGSGAGWNKVRLYSAFELAAVLRPENLAERTIPFLKADKTRFDSLQCIRQSAFSSEIWNKFIRDNEAITIPADSTEVIEISAGEETTGYLNIGFAGGKGAKVSILTSECYAYELMQGFGPGGMPRKGDRTDSVNGQLYGFTDTYTVGGAGTSDSPEAYEPYWFRTFRYIKLTIETSGQPLTLTDLHYLINGYPLEVVSEVETSDSTMKKIWEISERTLRLCMHETYEDCPFYEQLQYAMDSRSQILYTYAVSADDRLARVCIDNFRRAARHDGMINCSYPNTEMNVIPGFAVYYIGMLYDHMMYFGDKALLRENMPTVLGILNFFRNNISDSGLLGKVGGPLFQAPFWSFIDWTKPWQETIGVPPAIKEGPITMESLLLIMGFQYASEIFSYLGYGELSQQTKQESQAVQAAVNRNCRGKDGMFTDGPGVEDYSQHTQVFAILTDTVDIENGKKYLAETLYKPDEYAQCSVAMMFYLFRALEKCGMYERTYELWDVWRDMLGKNLTTCEEDPVSSRSDCHAWGALALYELPSVVLGIRPSAPGFSEIDFNPVPGRLTHAKGRVITPKGVADVSWESENGVLNVKASIPAGISIRGGAEREGYDIRVAD